MNNIDILEDATGGPFVVRLGGERYTLVAPQDLHWQHVLACLDAETAPGTPFDADGFKPWHLPLVFGGWSAHYDLPDVNSGKRLAYLIDRHRSALVADLQMYFDVDLGSLWRARRWRTLLDYIDHLPGHSWFSAAISNDEEHATMLAESMAQREKEGEAAPSGPSLQTWTPEVAMLTALRNDVRYLTYVTQAAAGDKAAKPPPPLPHPTTALENAMQRVQFQSRKASHEALVARMLPNKR